MLCISCYLRNHGSPWSARAQLYTISELAPKSVHMKLEQIGFILMAVYASYQHCQCSNFMCFDLEQPSQRDNKSVARNFIQTVLIEHSKVNHQFDW